MLLLQSTCKRLIDVARQGAWWKRFISCARFSCVVSLTVKSHIETKGPCSEGSLGSDSRVFPPRRATGIELSFQNQVLKWEPGMISAYQCLNNFIGLVCCKKFLRRSRSSARVELNKGEELTRRGGAQRGRNLASLQWSSFLYDLWWSGGHALFWEALSADRPPGECVGVPAENRSPLFNRDNDILTSRLCVTLSFTCIRFHGNPFIE